MTLKDLESQLLALTPAGKRAGNSIIDPQFGDRSNRGCQARR
jgi:hypothetical protein